MSQEWGYLQHYGIKGQVHGVRRFQNEDGSLTEEGKRRYGYYDRADGTKDYKRLQNDAKKDAEEFARAKAFYGEGAGTRRKVIKNKISERMKDPDYKKEFDKWFASQDMSKHQAAANRERKARDVKNATVRTARGVKNFLLGNAVPMTTAALAIGAALKYTGAGAKIANWGKTGLSTMAGWLRRRGMSAAGGTGASAFASFMGGRM